MVLKQLQKDEVGLCLISLTLSRINSKQIKDLRLELRVYIYIYILEESIGKNLHDPGFFDHLLDTTPKAQATK